MSNATESEKWPCGILDRVLLVAQVGDFLRTHRKGWEQLMEWMESVPPDRTEAEYEQEREASIAEHRAGVQRFLDAHNARRAADGLPPLDRQGNVIEGGST